MRGSPASAWLPTREVYDRAGGAGWSGWPRWRRTAGLVGTSMSIVFASGYALTV